MYRVDQRKIKLYLFLYYLCSIIASRRVIGHYKMDKNRLKPPLFQHQISLKINQPSHFEDFTENEIDISVYRCKSNKMFVCLYVPKILLNAEPIYDSSFQCSFSQVLGRIFKTIFGIKNTQFNRFVDIIYQFKKIFKTII